MKSTCNPVFPPAPDLTRQISENPQLSSRKTAVWERLIGVFCAVFLLAASLVAPGAAQASEPVLPAERKLVTPPPGFIEFCGRYRWVCENRAANSGPMDDRQLAIASEINERVNRFVTQLSDPENYGVAEYWTLPTNGIGDCEDFVLEKFKQLVNAGISSQNLSIAVVLDRARANHVVLVVHHQSGDLVLDSLTTWIQPWQDTGYRFLAMQSGANKAEWEVVTDVPRDGNLLVRR